MDYLQLARDLIAIESITGNEEGVVACLESRLTELGYAVETWEAAPNRRNLFAVPSSRVPDGTPVSSVEPSVIFCTHTDTVPPFLPVRENEEHIFGRGACDTKGITACFVEACDRLLAEGLDDFGLLFVVGEEVDNVGARSADERIRGKYVVVGEPTENQLAVGHKGAYAITLRVTGVACHSAYPDQGDSAMHRLLAGLQRALAEDYGHDEILGPATINVGRIEGGVAGNVLAPSAEADVVIRVVGPIDEVEAKFLACFSDQETGELDHRVQVEIHSRMSAPTLERLKGFDEVVVSYGTDIPFLLKIGRPLLYGPGSILDAHTSDEKISKAAMAKA
ncbi:MAG: M20/M25/M40 family metallo-hydrolase, partial [Planctomycetota bacterium]